MPYKLFFVPIIAAISAQMIKLAIDKIKGNFTLKSTFDTYGGMPSSHAAFVASLTTLIGFDYGIKSAVFAISVVFSIIILRDAMGLRRYVGDQASAINRLVNKLPKEETKSFKHQIENVGHTPLEIIVGCLYGIILAIIFI